MKLKNLTIYLTILLLLFAFTSCNAKTGDDSSSVLISSSVGSSQAQSNSDSVQTSSQTNSSSAASSSSSQGGFQWGVGSTSSVLRLIFPADSGYYVIGSSSFEWNSFSADSFTFYLEEKTSGGYKQIEKVTGLTGNKYTTKATLKNASTYRWRVEAIKDGKTILHTDSAKDGAVFMAFSKRGGSNDYKFDYKISEKVLKNYLARSTTFSFLAVPAGETDDDIRFILNTGAKYINRASLPWEAETDYVGHMKHYKDIIDRVHQADSDVILEAGIYETVFKSCEQVAIPAWVFAAFGKTPENRNFSYSKMLFPNGKYVDHWGSGQSVPDITQLETQMYFYFRACKYIDAGFEAIHWGQVMMIGENDTNHTCYSKVLNMVREYAKKNARRHFVLLNGSTSGMVGPDGILLYDFHLFPSRVFPEKGSIGHAPSASNPQKCILEVGHLDSIYKKSMGGKTYSGWTTSSLPYIVDLDNYGGMEQGYLNNANRDYWPWGMDEISWFANQPESYRASWLSYAYKWVKDTDPAGSLCMPGSRPIYSIAEKSMTWYYASSSAFCEKGYNDEAAIKSVWEAN